MRTAFAILIVIASLVGLSVYFEPSPRRLSSEAAYTDALSAADEAIKEVEVMEGLTMPNHSHTLTGSSQHCFNGFRASPDGITPGEGYTSCLGIYPLGVCSRNLLFRRAWETHF
ncbi:MAG: hypothetical protein ACRECF_08950, partial [Methyloceanibacter sp.]